MDFSLECSIPSYQRDLFPGAYRAPDSWNHQWTMMLLTVATGLSLTAGLFGAITASRILLGRPEETMQR